MATAPNALDASGQPTTLAEIIAYYDQYGVVPGSPQAAPQAYSYTTDPTTYIAPPVAPVQLSTALFTGPATFAYPTAAPSSAAAPPATAAPAQPSAPAAPAPAAAPTAAAPAVGQAPAFVSQALAPARAPFQPDITPGRQAVQPQLPPTTWQPHADFLLAGGAGGIGGSLGGIGAGIASAAVSFGISLAVTFLAGLFSSIFGGNDTAKLAKAIDDLKSATQRSLDELTRFAWAIANGLGALIRAIADIWDNFLDALWSALKRLWKLLWCVVDTVIPKIINILKNLRKYLDWIYQHILRPMQKWMQRARQVLQILKALHVPFASKLDRILTQIQGAVFGPLYAVLGWFNIYGSWVNAILTWDYTIQRPIFLRTMYKYQADWVGMWWSSQFDQSTPTPGVDYPREAVPPTIPQCAAEIGAAVKAGPGGFPPEVQAAVADFNPNVVLV